MNLTGRRAALLTIEFLLANIERWPYNGHAGIRYHAMHLSKVLDDLVKDLDDALLIRDIALVRLGLDVEFLGECGCGLWSRRRGAVKDGDIAACAGNGLGQRKTLRSTFQLEEFAGADDLRCLDCRR